jgi:RNA ligase (TIGR02306 family)
MAVATHRVEIVPVVLEPHPNADSLSLVKIYGWQVCTKSADWDNVQTEWAEGVGEHKLGAYIQPDSIVDVTRPEFSWLKRSPEDEKPHRVKVIRLRKLLSQGLLIPAPDGAQLGDDVAEQLGVRHYEPPTQEELDARQGGASASAEAYTGPTVWVPKYDIESMYRYLRCFTAGEPVYVSEKIHGQNSKFMFDGERMWAGTRKEWVKPGMGSPWKVLETHPWIEGFCRNNPMCILFGEIYGWVQVLRYGALPGEYWFRAFDVLEGVNYWDAEHFLLNFNEDQRVPLIEYGTPFDFEHLKAVAEGNTTLPVVGNTNPPDKKGKSPVPNIREGVVVRPVVERADYHLGRVVLKLVSNNYLETVSEPE